MHIHLHTYLYIYNIYMDSLIDNANKNRIGTERAKLTQKERKKQEKFAKNTTKSKKTNIY